MSDVRANPGVPVIAQFGGAVSPSACAPLVVDSTSGRVYAWKTGDVIVPQATGTGTATGTNTGDQTSIVGITGTLAEFNTALTGADFATGGGVITGTSSGSNTGDQDLSGLAPKASPIFTGAITETSRIAAWQFASWHPSDVAGTETAPSDTPTASLTATNYMTMASSSGVLTFTFTKAGNYLVLVGIYFTAAGTVYTSFYARLIVGGTGARYFTDTSIYNQTIDADSGKSAPEGFPLVVTATANQTITIAPKVAVTSVSAASNFTMSAAAQACYMGT